ncbi:hypothetical protein INR49_010136 [Caranx melampygus]|nr:hypothetical protein INR49_010136 [Caranx melampygus]
MRGIKGDRGPKELVAVTDPKETRGMEEFMDGLVYQEGKENRGTWDLQGPRAPLGKRGWLAPRGSVALMASQDLKELRERKENGGPLVYLVLLVPEGWMGPLVLLVLRDQLVVEALRGSRDRRERGGLLVRPRWVHAVSQGEMGPDGAKGDRGEPGMTRVEVSERSAAADQRQRTEGQRCSVSHRGN